MNMLVLYAFFPLNEKLFQTDEILQSMPLVLMLNPLALQEQVLSNENLQVRQ